jgi:hypothetical protein
MVENEDVDKLAASLKSSGVASSWIDAMNKAKAILGFSDRKEEAPKIKINEPTEEQKAKVDEIIKEVEAEIKGFNGDRRIEPTTIIQPEKPEILKNDAKNFDDPSFNIAESDMSVKDIVEAEEIFTNDPATLDKEKEGDKMEQPEDSQESGVVMTNDEITDEQHVESSRYAEKADVDEDEDTTYEEEKPITKGKTLFDFEK